jgi:hypothetical protein
MFKDRKMKVIVMSEKRIVRRDDFLKEVEKIAQTVLETGQVNYDKEEFKESFFRQSSHSPGNLEAMKYIEFGEVRKKYLPNLYRRAYGLKIKGKEVLLSRIMHYLENDEICRMIAMEFPDLTKEEIEAAQRVMTIIMFGLECEDSKYEELDLDDEE